MAKDIKNRNEQEAWMNRLRERLENYSEPLDSSGWEQIEKDLFSNKVPVHRISSSRRIWTIAAMLLILFGVSSLLWFVPLSQDKTIKQGNTVADVVVEKHRSSNAGTVTSSYANVITHVNPSLIARVSVQRKDSKVAVLPFSNGNDTTIKGNGIQDEDEVLHVGVNDKRNQKSDTVSFKANERKIKDKNRYKSRWSDRNNQELKESIVYQTKKQYPFSFGVNLASSGGLNMVNQGDEVYADILESGSIGKQSIPMANNSISVADDNIPNTNHVVYEGSDYEHLMPISIGLTIRKTLPYHLSAESGLVYTFLQSKIKTASGKKIGGQQLHYIGIPIKANWNFVDKKDAKVYISVGSMLEKCIYGIRRGDKISVNPMQFSINGGVGIEYVVAKRMGIYFETGVSHYYDDGSNVKTIRKETPTNIYLQGGIRLTY